MQNQAERRPLAVGVIGTGGMGARHAVNVHRFVSGARVAGVYDLDQARAGQVAAACGPAAVFTDPAALIAADGVEAVVIAAPDDTHAELTLACLRAGKPVLCEKPLATTAAAAGRVVQAEAALGRRLVAVGYMRRFDPQHLAIRALAHSGEIGQPLLFKGVHRNAQAAAGATSAVILSNSASHDLDSARWQLGGEVQAVSVRGLRSRAELQPELCDLLLIELIMADGRLAVVELFVNAAYGYEVSAEVVCQRGTAQTRQPGAALVRSRGNRGVPVASDWLAPFQEAYVAELHAWVEAVQTGRPFAGANAWDGYVAAHITDAG
ncbi:MAG: Gfo/Idh/MocA family oxidoreductase, partial [Anaerolineales bacterium]|nr:Gfo/Idh/MocA family oxidoreductase [Anaerolineales bacterium]